MSVLTFNPGNKVINFADDLPQPASGGSGVIEITGITGARAVQRFLASQGSGNTFRFGGVLLHSSYAVVAAQYTLPKEDWGNSGTCWGFGSTDYNGAFGSVAYPRQVANLKLNNGSTTHSILLCLTATSSQLHIQGLSTAPPPLTMSIKGVDYVFTQVFNNGNSLMSSPTGATAALLAAQIEDIPVSITAPTGYSIEVPALSSHINSKTATILPAIYNSLPPVHGVRSMGFASGNGDADAMAEQDIKYVDHAGVEHDFSLRVFNGGFTAIWFSASSTAYAGLSSGRFRLIIGGVDKTSQTRTINSGRWAYLWSGGNRIYSGAAIIDAPEAGITLAIPAEDAGFFRIPRT